MNDWQHGYVTDMPYTYGFYRECAPNWIDWVSLLKGSEPPRDTDQILELGCGQGYGLCLMAASNPDHRFVGVDFNPEHIAHARSLARRTDLKNVSFYEGDFIALASLTNLPWSECDYVIAHGMLSWVNSNVRSAIFKIIDKCLIPGGLAYFSYNSLPGWLPTHPVQHLMRQFADRTGINAVSFESALNALQRLKDVNANVFSAQPGLSSRLDQLQNHPKDQTNYLYHEYFNGAWSLFYSTQVADEAVVGKLRYLGSATLPDNYDGMLPENMRQVLEAAPDSAMRELYKDMLINQSFRRDVYVRGNAPVWSGEQINLFGQRMLTLLQDATTISLKFKTSFGEVSGREEVYKPIIQELTNGPQKIADLHKKNQNINFSHFLQAITLLTNAGAVGFYIPEAKKKSALLFNKFLADAISCGAPYRSISLPSIGSGIALDEIQWMGLDAYINGSTSLEQMAVGVENRLKKLNKSLFKDGHVLKFGDECLNELKERLSTFITTTLPLLRKLGGVK